MLQRFEVTARCCFVEFLPAPLWDISLIPKLAFARFSYTCNRSLVCAAPWATVDPMCIAATMECDSVVLQRLNIIFLFYKCHLTSHQIFWFFTVEENLCSYSSCKLSRYQPNSLCFHLFAIIQTCTYLYSSNQSPQRWKSLNPLGYFLK